VAGKYGTPNRLVRSIFLGVRIVGDMPPDRWRSAMLNNGGRFAGIFAFASSGTAVPAKQCGARM
jgi:hypothetical protein